jgi:hypothetical protein
MTAPKNCAACGRAFQPRYRAIFCSVECRKARSPAVYRFISPDGRSYVGSVADARHRGGKFGRLNSRIADAIRQFPDSLWHYEVLEHLNPGCQKRERLIAEQRHIDRLRSWSPDGGFNLHPAIWDADGPAQRSARRYRAGILAEARARQRARSERFWAPVSEIQKARASP